MDQKATHSSYLSAFKVMLQLTRCINYFLTYLSLPSKRK